MSQRHCPPKIQDEEDVRNFKVCSTGYRAVTDPEGSDFIWDFVKLPFPSYLGKYIIKIGKISAKIHEIGKIKAIFELGMTPI